SYAERRARPASRGAFAERPRPNVHSRDRDRIAGARRRAPGYDPEAGAPAAPAVSGEEGEMAAEFLAEPGPPIPDRVPDDLNRRYGASARRTVRGRPPRQRLAPRLCPH